MPHPDRVRAALQGIASTDPDLLRGPERWAMPRDMAGFSDLEAELLSAINAAGLPKPEWEYRFDPDCCEHTKRQHGMWTDNPPGVAAFEICATCIIGDDAHAYYRGRKWRFDFAWPALMLAVECEGGTFSGGRHTRGTGFEKDAEKYGEATARGWRVLRVTQRQITSGEALVLIERMMA